MPNNPRAGISRRIEGEDRTELKSFIKPRNPRWYGSDCTYSRCGKSAEALQQDLLSSKTLGCY